MLSQIHEALLSLPADGPNGERSFHPALCIPGFEIHGAVPEAKGVVIVLDCNGDGWALNEESAADQPVIEALKNYFKTLKELV